MILDRRLQDADDKLGPVGLTGRHYSHRSGNSGEKF